MALVCSYCTGDRFIVCTTGPQGDNHLLLYRYKHSSGKLVKLLFTILLIVYEVPAINVPDISMVNC